MLWARIDNFEDYLINTEGQIYSLRKNKYLRPMKDKNGYLRVSLYKNRKMYTVHIHRLVGETFIPNSDNKPCIDHINGIKTDNRVENLRFCTIKENNNFDLALKNKSKAQNRPEVREKKSIAEKKRFKQMSSDKKKEIAKKISKAQKIAMNKPETKEKLSKAMKISMNRPEVKEKISKAKSTKPFTVDGVEYLNLRQAARELGDSPSTIYRRLNNPKFTNYNYKGEI